MTDHAEAGGGRPDDTDSWLSKKVQSCTSNLRITSLYLCYDEYCQDDAFKAESIDEQSRWCNEHTNVTLPDYHSVVNRWKSSHPRDVTRLSAEDAFKWPVPVLGEVVVPDASFFERAFTTIEAAFQAYDLHLVYGWYMYYFWAAVVTVGVGTRLMSLFYNLGHKDHNNQPDGSYGTTTNGLTFLQTWLKQHITTPATFGNRCARPYGWCTIPPRIQSLTVFAFVAFNIILCCCSYRLTDGNLYWPKKSAQLLRFVSDRTGIVALANLPLVWLFGMRNDFLMWLTGWGFGTYNAFHKWAARIATLQAVIHSVGYTVMIIQSGGWSHFLGYWSKHYFWNGEVATVAMCALVALSFYGIRRAHYEVFLITHIIISIAALWSMYYHVEIFTAGEWNIFIWPCVIIWIADRAIRLGRILLFNRNPFNTMATVSYEASSNLVRMEVKADTALILPNPGTYYFVHVLNDVRYAHQSHPFTLAYNSANVSATPLSPISSRPTPHRTWSAEWNESDALLATCKAKAASKLVFLIRPYDGFTLRLKSTCLLHPKKLKVLVEGPYGQTAPLHNFHSVLFVVGGTGIAVALSHLAHLLSCKSHVQTVKVVWAVREHAFFASVLQDLKSLLGDERVEMDVHITRDDQAKDVVVGEVFKCIKRKTNRPDVHNVVKESAQDAGRASLAVVACGPALMADQARRASVEMLSQGHVGIEYFEESFKW
ncbi:similar to ferric-chelate reductase [Plenodomus lingam JN3]|uniref:Similar to ferric-chelate reductase n=1 Tax=Leptosphaeria maculans (strain JN3 / isolate v23.1.3 / race Av1-4-5-6-7-8) TaxID=985895 RepID=E5A166_LEPMJ|nr:similar to ferric-chelate reductase [Plenodomus lingam JN3]CBX97522.1 similar to ferric-chelate reductase [Plenodomus lingam JN3]